MGMFQVAPGFPPHGLSLQQGSLTSYKAAGFQKGASETEAKVADLLRFSPERGIVLPLSIAQKKSQSQPRLKAEETDSISQREEWQSFIVGEPMGWEIPLRSCLEIQFTVI